MTLGGGQGKGPFLAPRDPFVGKVVFPLSPGWATRQRPAAVSCRRRGAPYAQRRRHPTPPADQIQRSQVLPHYPAGTCRSRAMKQEYDFSKAKKNPYAKRLKRRVTMRLDGPVVDYLKGLAEETGVPYQALINLTRRDCADSKREFNLEWRPESVATG